MGFLLRGNDNILKTKEVWASIPRTIQKRFFYTEPCLCEQCANQRFWVADCFLWGSRIGGGAGVVLVGKLHGTSTILVILPCCRIVQKEGSEHPPIGMQNARNFVEVMFCIFGEHVGENRGEEDKVEGSLRIGKRECSSPDCSRWIIKTVIDIEPVEVKLRRSRCDGLATPADSSLYNIETFVRSTLEEGGQRCGHPAIT